MEAIINRIRATLPAVNDDILRYITGLFYLSFSFANCFSLFVDILETNKSDYIDFQEVDDALRPIFEEVAHNEREQAAIADLCQFVCDQLKLYVEIFMNKQSSPSLFQRNTIQWKRFDERTKKTFDTSFHRSLLGNHLRRSFVGFI